MSNKPYTSTTFPRRVHSGYHPEGHVQGIAIDEVGGETDEFPVPDGISLPFTPRNFTLKHAVSLAVRAQTEKDFDAIAALAIEYLGDRLANARTFKVETKRADKRFPMTSDAVSRELGGKILSRFNHLKVDVHNPQVLVKCEIRDDAAYIGAGQEAGAGGMPVGSNGRGLLLLSGGIDSPVAGWMMAKRGVKIEAVYYEAFPYTSIEAREKVIELARIVAGWAGSVRLHIVSLTEIEEEIAKRCTEDYFTLLLRRFMMTLAERCAKEYRCGALITGESLAQVASQTLPAIGVTVTKK